MSDDLISRRALLEAIDSSFVTPILKINMREEHKAVSKIWEIIVNMPTAFDKEKVIEKIKDESISERFEDVGISGNVYGHYSKEVIDTEEAIEIVERGGLI